MPNAENVRTEWPHPWQRLMQRCHECRPTIEQLRQHPWVNQDYHIAQPRNPVPKAGTGSDLFEPTVNPENLSLVSGHQRLASVVALM